MSNCSGTTNQQGIITFGGKKLLILIFTRWRYKVTREKILLISKKYTTQNDWISYICMCWLMISCDVGQHTWNYTLYMLRQQPILIWFPPTKFMLIFHIYVCCMRLYGIIYFSASTMQRVNVINTFGG